MPPTPHDKNNIAGLILNGGIFCLTAGVAGKAAIVSGLANSVAGNLAANNMFALGNNTFNKLIERLKTNDPEKVNYDLERLFRESAIVALEYIKKLFLAELKDDERLDRLSKQERESFIEGLKKFFDESIDDLRSVMKDEERI